MAEKEKKLEQPLLLMINPNQLLVKNLEVFVLILCFLELKMKL